MVGEPDVVAGRLDAVAGIAALFGQTHASMFRLAVLLLGEEMLAEDVVQEAYVRVYLHWRSAREPEAYLRTAVVNGCRSALRRRRTARAFTPPPARAAASAEEAAVAGATDGELLAVLASLPRRQREVLVLRYWCDLSEADIAACLGIGRGSVKTHASRGLATLSTRLEATT